LIESNFKDKKICITGGAGFIGSAIANRLFGIAEITIVDSLIPEYGGNLHNIEKIKDDIKFDIADVREKDVIENLVKDMDYIFNMAGQTSHMDSMTDPHTDLEINARAQLSILEAIRQHNPKVKIIFASTRQIYGRPDNLPVDESHPIRPVDVNGINKNAGEQYHKLYNDVYGIQTSILRLTNTYGPGMRVKDARQTFVGIWIQKILKGEDFEVWGGDQLRDFNYVDDVVDAFLKVAINKNANGEIFNLGSDEVITLNELADALIDVHGSGNYKIRNFPEDRKKIDIGDYYSDYSKINELLEWHPSVNIKEGLSKTLDYYRQHGEHYL